MTANLPSDFCPYKGLQPYTEQDRRFFFGRTRDEQIIISNLYAAQLTIFYGASGVGKSSVLLAGTVPLLKQEPNLTVVVFRNWQDPNFASQVKQQTLEAVSTRAGKQIDTDLSLPLDEVLNRAARGLRGPIFFVFDQFEEYFLYNPPSPDSKAFEAEFARAINRRDLNANFLLSMREDSLSKLDRFQGRIPTLMNNMLRLEHLDRDGAEEAIINPLDEYNRRPPSGQTTVTIEPQLVESVLDELRGVKVTSEQTGRGAVEDLSSAAPAAEIETPLLQMVLTRLWDEERAQVSRVLRLQTFEALGRAANIARTHLDTMMSRLTPEECNDAANILRYLVTPSGTKIAQEAGALGSWTELKEEKVQAILTRLSGQDMRILRTVQTPGQPVRYEIFHDVLARAILDWRGRYIAQQQRERIRLDEQERRQEEQEEAERRREKERSRLMRKAVTALSMLLLITIGVLVFALWQMHRATEKGSEANQAANVASQAAEAERRVAAELAELRNKQLQAQQHISAGQAYLTKKKFDEAVQEYDEAIKLDPDNPKSYNAKGYALMRLEKYQEAIETLEYLTSKVAPKYIWGHYNLALAYAKADKPGAIQEAKAVIEIDPAFCSTFKKDANYMWFVASPEYSELCVRQGIAAPQ